MKTMSWYVSKILFDFETRKEYLSEVAVILQRRKLLVQLINETQRILDKYMYQEYGKHKDFTIIHSVTYSTFVVYFSKDSEIIWNEYLNDFKKEMQLASTDLKVVSIDVRR